MSEHQQKALFLESPVGEFGVRSKPIPKPGPGELLVKIHSTALNPIDRKIRDFNVIVKEYPVVLGVDAAGTVEEIGECVKGTFKGDRVIHEGTFESDKATYQQFAVVPAEITAKVSASVSLGIITTAMGLYGDRPEGVPKYTPAWVEGGEGLYRGKAILIFGGSTSVGQYAIQLAKLSGFSPIMTTASSHNTNHLKSLGATHIIDRNAEIHTEITNILSNSRTPLDLIYDLVSDQETQTHAWDLLAPGGTLVALPPIKIDRGKYKDKNIVDDVFADVHVPKNRRFGISLFGGLTGLLERGAIKPNRVDVLQNGLAGIPEGLDRVRKNKVSGTKLVTRPWETT